MGRRRVGDGALGVGRGEAEAAQGDDGVGSEVGGDGFGVAGSVGVGIGGEVSARGLAVAVRGSVGVGEGEVVGRGAFDGQTAFVDSDVVGVALCRPADYADFGGVRVEGLGWRRGIIRGR